MADPRALIEDAFAELASREGYTSRPDQKHLALLLSDCIEGKSSGAFEAPTGLGKSLAAIIPAIANAHATGKRTVIATYTNVLAEQYWRADLPLALSLFDIEIPNCQFLIGRQRYACVAAIKERESLQFGGFRANALMGIETEFRKFTRKPARELNQLWKEIVAPPVCAGRMCPHFHDCYYYRARRGAEKASIVITNHSVVIQDALLRRTTDGEQTMLGDYDFLIIDEAHDFPQAALNGLEFEVSESKVGVISALVGRIENSLMPMASALHQADELKGMSVRFKQAMDRSLTEMSVFGMNYGTGILAASPHTVMQHPQVLSRSKAVALPAAKKVSADIAGHVLQFVEACEGLVRTWKKDFPSEAGKIAEAWETLHNYAMFLREFGMGCVNLFQNDSEQDDVSVTYCGGGFGGTPMLRRDVIGLAGPLRELIWSQRPYACLSATLALDNSFNFFRGQTGAEPTYEEILPSPFDFASQAAVYMPEPGLVRDPTIARKEGQEELYYREMAAVLSDLIRTIGGRTLALFHSRKEMEGVYRFMDLPDDLPVLTQRPSGAAATGDKFREDSRTSLFALRSFWTGFDAPGETLSCVALVRVPFEVPIDPPQVARIAWMQARREDAFNNYSLPAAKMLMRQGAGRLIRRSDDRGIIALLDPRLRTKRYGEDIVANLPAGMRVFAHLEDAVAHVGLESGLAAR